MKNYYMMPDWKETYIDIAWRDHAAKMEELNAAIEVREWVEGIIAQHSAELEELASQASEALPWGPEIESQDWTGQAPAGLEWLEE